MSLASLGRAGVGSARRQLDASSCSSSSRQRWSSLSFLRPFSCSSARFGSADEKLERIHRTVPQYPYAPRNWYKQSNFGLYAGRHIRFGNSVSDEYENKNRRWWRPNVQSKRLWSEALGRLIRIRVTARVLRTIDKVGGLDEYLLGEKPARIKELGMGGWLLRWRMIKTTAVTERFAEQRQQMGLPPVVRKEKRPKRKDKEGEGEIEQAQPSSGGSQEQQPLDGDAATHQKTTPSQRVFGSTTGHT